MRDRTEAAEQQTIKSRGRGFDSTEVGDFFSLPGVVSHFLTWANVQ